MRPSPLSPLDLFPSDMPPSDLSPSDPSWIPAWCKARLVTVTRCVVGILLLAALLAPISSAAQSSAAIVETAVVHASASGVPRVAVLVHGFQGFWPWSRGFRCSDGLVAFDEAGAPTGRSPRAEGEFGRLAQTLAARGFDVYLARWTSHGSQTVSLAEAGDCLGQQVAEARRRAAARGGVASIPQVTLVGHSMGGLVSRSYVEGPDYASRGDVDHVITFGTPHLGVAPDILLRLLAAFNPASIAGGFLPCATSPGTCELSYDAVAAFNRGHSPRREVAYDVVAGDKAIYPFSWFIAGSDDGLVESNSAAGLPAARWRVNDSHAALSGLVTDFYMQSDESARCLDAFLGLGNGRSSCVRFGAAPRAAPAVAVPVDAGPVDGVPAAAVPMGAVSADAGGQDHLNASPAEAIYGDSAEPPGPQASSLPSAGTAQLPMTPIETATIEPGQGRTFPLQLDGSPGVVVVGIAGGWVAATLRLPDGRTLRPTGSGRGPRVFRLADAPAGSATLTLHNGGVAAADVALFAVLASPIMLDVSGLSSGGAASAPGSRVGLSVRVMDGGRGVPGARVEAAWPVGNRVERVLLEDVGDGVYRTDLVVPDARGLYHVVIRAAGTSAAGIPFERAVGAVWVVGGNE
jgi:hypothetical protein